MPYGTTVGVTAGLQAEGCGSRLNGAKQLLALACELCRTLRGSKDGLCRGSDSCYLRPRNGDESFSWKYTRGRDGWKARDRIRVVLVLESWSTRRPANTPALLQTSLEPGFTGSRRCGFFAMRLRDARLRMIRPAQRMFSGRGRSGVWTWRVAGVSGKGRAWKRLVRRAWMARGGEEACGLLQGYVGTLRGGQEGKAVVQTAGKIGLFAGGFCRKANNPIFQTSPGTHSWTCRIFLRRYKRTPEAQYPAGLKLEAQGMKL